MLLYRAAIRIDVSYCNNAWQVSIIEADHSEHRSFRSEAEAREYAKVRLEQMHPSKSDLRLN